MKEYSCDSVYFSATAKLPSDMPSGEMYKAVDIGLVINPKSGLIEDTSITLLTDEARTFIKQLIVGFNINDSPIEDLIEVIRARYFGASQKAICVALKLIHEKYISWQKQ